MRDEFVKNPEKWAVEDVVVWLSHIQCPQPYRALLRTAAISGEKLLKLDQETIENLGIARSQDVKKLLGHIKQLKSDGGYSLSKKYPKWDTTPVIASTASTLDRKRAKNDTKSSGLPRDSASKDSVRNSATSPLRDPIVPVTFPGLTLRTYQNCFFPSSLFCATGIVPS